MYALIRPLLFLLPPELASKLTLKTLNGLHHVGLLRHLVKQPKDDPVTVMGLRFKNRIGLAAGLDVNGDYMHALADLGFGHIEVGGVTPEPQAGNPSPWVFRLPEYQAIINRKGFGNKGVDYLVERLKHRPTNCIIGVNVAKGKETPLEQAVEDYQVCLHKLAPYVDYFAINISSPNTVALRELQSEDYLGDLLAALTDTRDKLPRKIPLVLKISPDLTQKEIENIAKCCKLHAISAIIATNTTTEKQAVCQHPLGAEQGGLSGKPLTEVSLQALKTLYATLGDTIPIISVGGIMTPHDARVRLSNNAALLQIFTGLVYYGPGLISQI